MLLLSLLLLLPLPLPLVLLLLLLLLLLLWPCLHRRTERAPALKPARAGLGGQAAARPGTGPIAAAASVGGKATVFSTVAAAGPSGGKTTYARATDWAAAQAAAQASAGGGAHSAPGAGHRGCEHSARDSGSAEDKFAHLKLTPGLQNFLQGLLRRINRAASDALENCSAAAGTSVLLSLKRHTRSNSRVNSSK